ncbi:MAG: L-threonylcarbamoyladenylate synthase [Bacteroidota bacterium]|nr:L-threonylcarbamoyladenylate synthase [Bacteroidota bacterium]
MTEIIKDIDLAVKEINTGNVVGLPTETVYGLGANALKENAVLKIFETKQRPKFNPIIVHVYNENDFENYSVKIPENVYKLIDKFSPGPITFILKKKFNIPDIVTSGNDSVGLRIPSHNMFREILKETKLPIAAPSANRFGKISPTSAEDVLTELKGKINYILDGGRCEIGIESTVISFAEDEIKILRHGFVTKEQIEKVIGKISDGESKKIISPGLSKNHYAPSTPLYFVNDYNDIKNFTGKKIGLLDFSKYKNMKEIALNLFSDLRKLDSGNFDFIIYKKADEEGLGIAINDRLQRASSGELKTNFPVKTNSDYEQSIIKN